MIKRFLRRLGRWKAAALSPMGFIMIIASALPVIAGEGKNEHNKQETKKIIN